MDTFIMLTRLSPASLHSPARLEELEQRVTEAIRTECPTVEWISSYAIAGPYDYLDLFKAPNLESALKVATLVRTFGHAHTEIWPGVPWRKFKDLVRHLPERAT
jgi:hypothetical protein